MATTVHLDINADPKAHISVNAITVTARDASVRVTIFHGDDSTFIWLTPSQARVIRGGIGVALDQLDTTEAQSASMTFGGDFIHDAYVRGEN